MAAVVECVLDNATPPAELRLAWYCQRWGALPKSGGVYEQDYQTMHRMAVLQNIYNTVVHVKDAKPKEIHHLSDNERRILRVLMDNKLLFS